MAKRKKSNSSPDTDILGNDVDGIIDQLTKEFGEGVAFRTEEDFEAFDREVISTGILSLDRALGVGGIPIGRIIEVFGAEMSGKSSLALKIAGEAQRKGIAVVYLDLEHTLDLELAMNSGMDTVRNCVIAHPEFGEQAMEIIELIIRQRNEVFVVVDSVAALLPKVELETEFTKSTQLGRQAALMTEALRKLAGRISKSNSTVLFVNQTRQKIGGYMSGAQTTPGGNALKFWSSIRIQVNRDKTLTQGDEVVGHIAKIKIKKNKLAAPFKEIQADLFYGSGFCGISDILKIATENDIVTRSGAWYAHGKEKLGQGLYSTLKTLIGDPTWYFQIRDQVAEVLGVTFAHDKMYYDKTIKLGEETYQSRDVSDIVAPTVEEGAVQ
jgi:recombination protein RecA